MNRDVMRVSLMSKSSIGWAVVAVAISSLVAAPSQAAGAPPVITGLPVNAWEIVQSGGRDLTGAAVADSEANHRVISGTYGAGAPVDVYCVTKDATKNYKISTVYADGNGLWVLDFDLKAVYNGIGTDHLSCKYAAVGGGNPAPLYADISGLVRRFILVEAVVIDGTLRGYWFQVSGTDGFIDGNQAADCPLCDAYVAKSDDTVGPPLFYYDAALSATPIDNLYGLEVDGRNAFMGRQLRDRYTSLPLALSIPTFSIMYDAGNGDLSITESTKIVRCFNPALNDYWNVNCFKDGANQNAIDTGVSFTRTTHILGDGQTYRIEDSFTSSDSAAHTVTARYIEEPVNTSEVQFPVGSTSLPGGLVTGYDGKSWIPSTTRWGSTHVVAPAGEPTVVNIITDYTSAPSVDNPVGSITYAHRPDYFVGRAAQDTHFFAVYSNRTVDATTPLNVQIAYEMASSQEKHVARAAANLAYVYDNFFPVPDLTWNASTSVLTTTTSLSELASTTSGRPITYSVHDAGTTGCTIDASSGAVAFTGPGTCVLTASIASGGEWSYNSRDLLLTVTNPVVAAMCRSGMDASISFAYGKSALSGAATSKLSRFASAAKKAGCTRITVTGFTAKTTSVIGANRFRRTLAQQRANAVKAYLQHWLSVNHASITIRTLTAVRSDKSATDSSWAAIRRHLRADLIAS